ncbi:Ribosomal large subunit pseudouridine synthase D, partial [termite gut metagenome]
MNKNKPEKQGKEQKTAPVKTPFTIHSATEDCELMDFIMTKARDGIGRAAAKALLSKRQVLVNNVITTQYNFALKSGMKIRINKNKGLQELHSNLLRIVYEDA